MAVRLLMDASAKSEGSSTTGLYEGQFKNGSDLANTERGISMLQKLLDNDTNPFLDERATIAGTARHGCIEMPSCNFGAASVKAKQSGIKNLYEACRAACRGLALSCR